MKRKITFFAISLLTMGSVFSQTLPDGMVSLLPAGVTANISNATVGMKSKDLVVAGNKTNGYKAFFAATDVTNGEELWVTDGTQAGTNLVKDIRTGSTGSTIEYLTRFNDKVVFAANDGTNGAELWISDGTEAGTMLLVNINTDVASSDPRGFTQLNETQFIFVAKNATSGTQTYLYVSDGTPSGTQLIYECDAKFPGAEYLSTSYVTPYCRVGRKVFFKAATTAAGEELWVTDGTALGTKQVKDINAGTTGAAVNHFVNFYNEKLFLKATNGSAVNGAEPWASDGNEATTYMIKDSNPGTGSGGVSTPGIKPYNGKIYFRGYDPTKGTELACTNFEADNLTVFDINLTSPTATNNSAADTGVEFDGVLFFDADAKGVVGIEAHYTDGNTVTLHSDRAVGTPNFFMRDQVVVSGSMYWYNGGGPNTSADYFQLFRLNNKTDVIERVVSLYTDATNQSRFHSLRNLGGELIAASYPVVGGTASATTNSLYAYHYRKSTFNPLTETDNLEPEYRTRAEIALTTNVINTTENTPNLILKNSVLKIQDVDKNAQVLIYDAIGRMIVNKTLNDNSLEVKLPFVGMYTVRIETGAKNWTKKIINQN